MKTLKVEDIRAHFKNELIHNRFTTSRNGDKTIELIGASFIADEPAIFGTVNEEYVRAELDWYKSCSLNVHDIHADKPAPKQWLLSANSDGYINSNYGYLIYSAENGNQYDNCLAELLRNPDSRRAIMIYNRPSMHVDYNADGKNDFVCTNAVSYYVRDGYINAVVQMRSNDSVFGYKNDRAWAKHVLEELVDDYNNAELHPIVYPGKIFWQVQNLHVYERHFHLVV